MTGVVNVQSKSGRHIREAARAVKIRLVGNVAEALLEFARAAFEGFNKDWIDYFWHNVHNNMPPDGLPVIVISPQYDKVGPDINLFFNDKVEEAVRELGKTFKWYRRPIYVNIGGECDFGYRVVGSYRKNRSQGPEKFVRMFRRVHDIWTEEGATNVIEVHINRLRGKLDKGFDRSLIQTIRGRGYALRAS